MNSLEYDKLNNRYSNADGVDIEVPGFGQTDTVEYIDDLGLLGIFHNFVEFFVARGYVRGESIRAAPYDWRLAAGT